MRSRDKKNQGKAVKSGDKMAEARSVEKGAKDTKEGASALKSNPELYDFANKMASPKLEELGAEIEIGSSDAKDENDLLGEFNTKVRQYTNQPAQ